MKRKHPVKIKPNQHQGALVGCIFRPVSSALMPPDPSPQRAGWPPPSRPAPERGHPQVGEATIPES